jgi:hypothetical protein
MNDFSWRRTIFVSALILTALSATQSRVAHIQSGTSQSGTSPSGVAAPTEIKISNGPIPIRVLVQSPADSATDLQIICLFASTTENTLHGSLIEMNDKLSGLLDRIRHPNLFRGELGETLLIAPSAGTISAKRLLIIGLGDSETFTAERMDQVGSIVYRESNRLGVADPYFAPTILDGGVTKFATGEISEQFMRGFLRAANTERILKDANDSTAGTMQDFTFLAGQAHASDTKQGIERAIAAVTTK